MKKIAVVGLGYVGLPLAVELGKSRPVIGYDVSLPRIQSLQSNSDITNECSEAELKAAKHLHYTANLDDLKDASVYIVTVPTPIDNANRPNLTPLLKASHAIGSVISKGDIVIYESTVFPGATEEVCVPELEAASGLTFNKDFFCGYSPERINPGDRVNTITKITKITSGSTDKIAKEVDDLYQSIIEAGTWSAPSIKVAEAAKVIENCQRDLNIAFVNELALIFDRLDIDTMDVLEAAESKWNFLPFKPGIVGGHCIGVDPYYLTHKAEEVGYSPQVILAGRNINDNMANYVAKSVLKRMSCNGMTIAGAKIAVLGVTFKENCPDIRNSKVFDIIDELRSWNVDVVAVDDWADKEEVRAEYCVELQDFDTIQDADAVIVAVGHGQFKEIAAQDMMKICKADKIVFGDLKSLFDRDEFTAAGFDIFRL